MLLASMDFWNIVNRSNEVASSNADPKVLKEYQRHVKQAISNISLDLADNQLMHIKSCAKDPRRCGNFFATFMRRKICPTSFSFGVNFTCKIQEDTDLLDHINKVNVLANQLACTEVLVKDEDILLTLLDSLPTSYKYLITALKMILMKDLTIN
jgi:hypothetical protein